MNDTLDRDAIKSALDQLPDWRIDSDSLLTSFAAPTAGAALALVAAIGEVAEEANHHPDVDWRYDHVFVLTTSHDVGSKITQRDVDLATRISSLAGAAGAVAEPDNGRRGA